VKTKKARPERTAGILLHPTSLPGPYGVGDLGPAARAWVDALARAGQGWWQVLPLGLTGCGDSPYQSFSAFGGNPLLVSPDGLVADGLLSRADLARVHLADVFAGDAANADYEAAGAFKAALFARAWENFQAGAAPALREPFETFCVTQAPWLDNLALFMALKDAHGGQSWQEWPAPQRLREPDALEEARRELADAVWLHRFRQFLFFRQWAEVKAYAHEHGVKLIGDVPIFVAADSVDVWAHPELFLLDRQRRPTVVAGVPPDYFSATGQLWGNPLYDWKAMKETDYAWWVARLRATLDQVDLVRLDHFRGFEAYWEVPAGNPTAEVGQWVQAPGADLIATLRRELGRLPLIAEDLGLITPEVEALRDQFNLPGMRILQFAFGGATDDRFLPHNYDRNTVVYTGTHDNDTTHAWYAGLPARELAFLRRYLPSSCGDVAWDLIRLAWSSVADLAVAPLQDVLSLGNEGRMNRPGRPAGNWRWRFTADRLTAERLDRLADLTDLYAR
jgi:4-alpha-glucanotransferase